VSASRRRARLNRDLIVPTGTPSAAAASAGVSPDQHTNAITSRCCRGSTRNAWSICRIAASAASHSPVSSAAVLPRSPASRTASRACRLADRSWLPPSFRAKANRIGRAEASRSSGRSPVTARRQTVVNVACATSSATDQEPVDRKAKL